MQQGSSNTGTATLTDEQILGLDGGLETVNLTGGPQNENMKARLLPSAYAGGGKLF